MYVLQLDLGQPALHAQVPVLPRGGPVRARRLLRQEQRPQLQRLDCSRLASAVLAFR